MAVRQHQTIGRNDHARPATAPPHRSHADHGRPDGLGHEDTALEYASISSASSRSAYGERTVAAPLRCDVVRMENLRADVFMSEGCLYNVAEIQVVAPPTHIDAKLHSAASIRSLSDRVMLIPLAEHSAAI